MKELSKRQQAVLDFIGSFLDDNDYPPTIRDIQRDLGISSTSVVDYNLRVLEERDLIRRNRNISRGIELVGRAPQRRKLVTVPVVGQIAAGAPIPDFGQMADAPWVETVDLNADLISDKPDGLFALRVKGHSMVDALINDGDIVILRQQKTCENGETVAVWLEEEKETTLKRFYHEDSQVRLQPANVTMEPIFTTPKNVTVQGRLVSVVRHIN